MNLPRLTLYPGNQRAEFYLPWRGSAGRNFEWIKTVCGKLTRPQYDKEKRRFMIARAHTDLVLEALLEEYSCVKVDHYGFAKTTCVEQCWNANPENFLQCECSCAGQNHGSGHPMGKEVISGLSIQGEYVLATYVVGSRP